MESVSAALNFCAGTAGRHNLKELLKHVSSKNMFVCSVGRPPVDVNCIWVNAPAATDGLALSRILAACRTRYLLLLDCPGRLTLANEGLERWMQKLQTSQSALSFASYRQNGLVRALIDYQSGSVRDDFDFGPMLLIDVQRLNALLARWHYAVPLNSSGWYGVRLMAAIENALPVRVAEPLYSVAVEHFKDDFEREHFRYVDSGSLVQQKELEETFTLYAKAAGFYIPPFKRPVEFGGPEFSVEMSVVIPVKDRVRTIGQAVESALRQKASFPFNLIVVDNHSEDGTTRLIAAMAARDKRIVHLIPPSSGLQIGGCWNEALRNAACGRFCVQLDSDDLYAGENTLEVVREAFYASAAAAVVGSYRVVDFSLREVNPGVVAHREWTDDNGRNNALRVNGFGAPRAFYREIARDIGFPDVSYGEDYAMMLAISRQHNIARIFEPFYLCRRWEGNSDAAPSPEKMDANNYYKDTLRSAEIAERRKLMLQS